MLGVSRKTVLIEEIWSLETTAVHHLFWANAVMAKNRFKFLFSKLTFDDIDTRKERALIDPKLHKISKIFNRIRSKIKCCFEASDFLCIDESLYPFRGC